MMIEAAGLRQKRIPLIGQQAAYCDEQWAVDREAPPDYFCDVVTVHLGHCDVQDHRFGLEPLNGGNDLKGVVDRGNLVAFILENGGKGLDSVPVVVGDEYAKRTPLNPRCFRATYRCARLRDGLFASEGG